MTNEGRDRPRNDMAAGADRPSRPTIGDTASPGTMAVNRLRCVPLADRQDHRSGRNQCNVTDSVYP